MPRLDQPVQPASERFIMLFDDFVIEVERAMAKRPVSVLSAVVMTVADRQCTSNFIVFFQVALVDMVNNVIPSFTRTLLPMIIIFLRI